MFYKDLARTLFLFLICIFLSKSLINNPIAALQETNAKDSLDIHDRFKSATKLFNENDLDNAYRQFLQIMPQLEKAKEWHSYTRSLLFIADIHRMKSDFDSAFYYLNRAKATARLNMSRNDLVFADINHKFGVTLIDKGNFEEARNYIEQAILLRSQPGLSADSGLSFSYNSLGNIYFYRGDYFNARDYYKKALDNAKKTKKIIDLDLSFYYQNMGIIYATLGDYDSANVFMNSSLLISKNLMATDDTRLERLYMNLGRLFFLSGNNDSATEYYDLAEKVYTKTVGIEHYTIGNLLSNKGAILINKSDYELALQYYRRALAIFLKNIDKKHPYVLGAYMNIGYLYEKKRKLSNSHRIL